MKNLYSFYWDCGTGTIEGLFLATEQEVEDAIGCELWFGEVLGKHSEVCGELEAHEVVRIMVSESTIQDLEKTCGNTICGYNPLNYICE